MSPRLCDATAVCKLFAADSAVVQCHGEVIVVDDATAVSGACIAADSAVVQCHVTREVKDATTADSDKLLLPLTVQLFNISVPEYL